MIFVGESTGRIDFIVHLPEEAKQRGVLLLQSGLVSIAAVKIGECCDPQCGVSGDSVDILVDRRDEARKREVWEKVVAKDVADNRLDHIQVAGPAAAVSLGRIPNAVLHT